MSERHYWLHTPSGPRGPFTLPELIEAAREPRHPREPKHLRKLPPQPNLVALADAVTPLPDRCLDVLDSLLRGPLRTLQVIEDTGRSMGTVCRSLQSLYALWFVTRTRDRRWHITNAGRWALTQVSA